MALLLADMAMHLVKITEKFGPYQHVSWSFQSVSEPSQQVSGPVSWSFHPVSVPSQLVSYEFFVTSAIHPYSQGHFRMFHGSYTLSLGSENQCHPSFKAPPTSSRALPVSLRDNQTSLVTSSSQYLVSTSKYLGSSSLLMGYPSHA